MCVRVDETRKEDHPFSVENSISVAWSFLTNLSNPPVLNIDGGVPVYIPGGVLGHDPRAISNQKRHGTPIDKTSHWSAEKPFTS
jgi:hypothetical protein